MQWNEAEQKWLMKLRDGTFVYDFWDCKTVRKAFKDISKEKTAKYRVTIEKIKDL